MERNCVHTAREVENGGDLYPCLLSTFFFSFLKHLLLSSLSARSRWAGGQARPKLGGGDLGGRQGKVGQPQS